MVKKIFAVLSSFPGGASLVLAESLSAGLCASTIAQVPGASKYLWGAFVCYTNKSKEKLLGVSSDLLKRHGAVSGEVVCALAEGALSRSSADFAIALSGEAGPRGMEAPVGDVWLAFVARNGNTEIQKLKLRGRRNSIRRQAVYRALKNFLCFLNSCV